jgi:hypothetical protein
VNTEAIWQHDQCPRLRTWSALYELPRVPLVQALHDSLRAGLVAGNGMAAREAFMAMAARPGLDIESNYSLYDLAVHHAAMLEVITEYLAADGAWKPCAPVDGFSPQSFLMPDGRLRRVVLCSAWNDLREQEERTSWRTVADTAMTGRPMLVNAIVIGQSRKGFRPSPWTTGYVHPENRTLRIQKREGKFTDNWKRVYREQTDEKPDAWLKLMQDDGAFEGLVYHFSVNPAGHDAQRDIVRINKEIAENRTDMRRSACFRYAPCPFARLCHNAPPMTPDAARWARKV